MCDMSEKTKHEVELVAPCGKKVALDIPDAFNPSSDDVEIGVAIGTLMKLLGYDRRGWQLNIEKVVTQATPRGVYSSGSTRQIHSR